MGMLLSYHIMMNVEDSRLEDKLNVIPPCNEVLEFHGVTIGRELEHGINDVWFCKELNGPYLQNK